MDQRRPEGPHQDLGLGLEGHKSEEAQRGGARKAKTARTEDDEDYVNHTGSTNTEDSSPMEGFVREGEGTDAALERHFGISSMQR